MHGTVFVKLGMMNTRKYRLEEEIVGRGLWTRFGFVLGKHKAPAHLAGGLRSWGDGAQGLAFKPQSVLVGMLILRLIQVELGKLAKREKHFLQGLAYCALWFSKHQSLIGIQKL